MRPTACGSPRTRRRHQGANRFDTFWGAGAEAERIAGGMSASGSALILLPRGSIARIEAARAHPLR